MIIDSSDNGVTDDILRIEEGRVYSNGTTVTTRITRTDLVVAQIACTTCCSFTCVPR